MNRAVNEFHLTESGKILDKTRSLVLETFGVTGDVNDGMDISLCSLKAPPYSKGQDIELQWSGANNPLWYMYNREFKEITADKQSIGRTDNPKPFTTHTINITLPDGEGADVLFYLFTDGYADQFGGAKGKKFKYKQLQDLLLVNADKSMEEQKKILEGKFSEWKGVQEQTDDVCIIGIKL